MRAGMSVGFRKFSTQITAAILLPDIWSKSPLTSRSALRTGAGREAAKKRGVRFGRPRELALDQGELALRLVSEGKSVREIASVFNVHPATIYRLAAYSATGMVN